MGPNIKMKRKLSVKLNKVFNIKQKSDSTPSTPTKPPQQQARPSIIIGATYSHSDNEMIEKIHSQKLKKKRKLFSKSINNKESTLENEEDEEKEEKFTFMNMNIDIN